MEHWPDWLQEWLAADVPPTRAEEAFLLLTVDADGFARVALLSAGELVLTGGRTLRLALWPGSQTTANLRRNGCATLAAFAAGSAWYFRLHIQELGELPLADGTCIAFAATLITGRQDAVAYARITHGVGYALADPAATWARWQATRRALRQLGEGGPASAAEGALA